MEIISRIEPANKDICVELIPEQYSPGKPLLCKSLNFKHPDIDIKNEFIKTDGFFIIDSNMHFGAQMNNVFEIKGECIIMIFNDNGGALNEIKGLDQPLNLGSNVNNLFYSKGFKSTITLESFNMYAYFCVILSKDFYFHLFHKDLSLHSDFVKRIDKNESAKLSKAPLITTNEMKWLIYAIKSCNRDGEFKRIFIETKITELLLLQFEQFKRNDKKIVETNVLREDEKVQIHEARAILESDIINPPNIKQLSKLVGLNEFKLKAGFKLCCNITIHQYIIRLRMNKARKLLQEGELSIGEIANMVGYKTSAHFSKSYKLYYNTLPSRDA